MLLMSFAVWLVGPAIDKGNTGYTIFLFVALYVHEKTVVFIFFGNFRQEQIRMDGWEGFVLKAIKLIIIFILIEEDNQKRIDADRRVAVWRHATKIG